MMNAQFALQPDLPPDAAKNLARVAAGFARYFPELSGAAAPRLPDDFSLTRFLQAHAAQRQLDSRELAVCKNTAAMLGQEFDPLRPWVPFAALRTMTTQPGAKGGYLVDSDTLPAADVLRPWSVTARAGVTMITGLTGDATIPRVTTATTGAWLDESGAGASEAPPTLGSASLKPRTAISLIHFPIKLIRQSESVEPFLRTMLLRSVGELLDTAVYAGAGGVQPLGLVNTPGIGVQSGVSLAHAGLLAMRKSVLVSGGDEDRLRWIGTPGVQELLGARVRETGSTGGGRFLWDDEGILGTTAHATKDAPANTLIVGDFSTVVAGVFGPGLRIDIDPSQNFNSAGLTARVMLMVDVCFPRPEAFAVATSVS